ncbi:MAG: hypothetical protein JWQ90_5571 [Hydrocarboniphaga sp.]|uniref:DUF1444 family protein n=1 Tax=Hydrocarboniphaga sp. TaxID=2033016 RepID=UPI00261CD977|nr:DUF1444 family protein [Hydrocarboniphaga sp.]MDB5973121.1 hypothetical protein [Hydrocarboniphaga sp.]
MSILFWRGRTTKKRFQERFAEFVRAEFPRAEVRPGAELEVVVTGLRGSDSHTIWLGRAYQEFEKNPENVEEILRRWLGPLEDSDRDAREKADLADLVPMIKDIAWIEQQRRFAESNDAVMDTWTAPYNSELVMLYADFRSGICFLTKSDVDALGKSAEDLHQIALENLRQRTPERSVIGENGRYLIGAGGNFEATLLLDDQLWLDTRLKVRGMPIVGVPDRDSLVVTGSDDPSGVLELAAMTARLHRTERYAISDKLFIRRGNRFDLLDPDPVDESHPIPNLDVIDVHARKKGRGSTLVIIIASPLRSDARSIYRLFKKLDGYVQYISSAAYAEECGSPDPATTTIEVHIHTESDRRISNMITSLRGWVENAKASLAVTILSKRT